MHSQRYYSLDEIRATAAGRWIEILGHFGIQTELLQPRHGPCPGCGGRDRFRFDDIGGGGTFICSQGSGSLLVGDGLKLLGHCKDWDWKQCAKEVGDYLNLEARSGSPRPRATGVALEPRQDVEARPELDREKVREFIRGVPELDFDWFRRRSPIDVVSCESGAFLGHLYEEGDRVCVFTDWRSQGDFLFWVGHGAYRLSRDRDVKAVRSDLPAGAPEGVWFLVQPISGKWEVNHKVNRDALTAKWTRRSEVNVTAWRYFVLESDVLGAEEWMRVLANLALPVAAIYTSGGRSIHALVKIPATSKAGWDGIRNALRMMVCPLGADPGALSAVRLSRLPGCRRKDRLQRLLYLNPNPDRREIRMMPEVRG